MWYGVTGKVATNCAWKSSKNVKNVFTEGETFDLGIKCVRVVRQRSKDTLSNMLNLWTNQELWKEHGLFRENLTVFSDLNEGLESE